MDLSGDSWVHRAAFSGLSKHPNLRILRLGHFEHSDLSCDQLLKVIYKISLIFILFLSNINFII